VALTGSGTRPAAVGRPASAKFGALTLNHNLRKKKQMNYIFMPLTKKFCIWICPRWRLPACASGKGEVCFRENANAATIISRGTQGTFGGRHTYITTGVENQH
jgi:hypothetical protein